MLLFIVTACAKNSESVDNWETPTLAFKRGTEDSSKTIFVTSTFQQALAPDDQFEFIFKGDNAKKQKSIANVSVRAKCAEDSEFLNGVFEESFDLGARAAFRANELLPPQSVLENAKALHCRWSIIAKNFNGSTRTFTLPFLRLEGENFNSTVNIVDNEGKPTPQGTTISFRNSRALTFNSPDPGSFNGTLRCDLLSIKLQPGNNAIGDFIAQESDNEILRYKHPMQRCFVELRSSSGKIYRSAGFVIYLFPRELATTQVEYVGNENFEKTTDGRGLLMGKVRITNNSDQERLFGIQSESNTYDVFFFDDHGTGGSYDNLPNSGHYWYERKTDGKVRWANESYLQFTEVAGTKYLVVRPHQDIKDVAFLYQTNIQCSGTGEFSLGGIRVPFSGDLLNERAPYFDKKGKLIDFAIPGTSVQTHTPIPYFLRVFHNKLVGNPKTYNREWREVKRGC